VSPKVSRLLLIATVAAGFGILPMQGASAGGPGIDVYNPPVGFTSHSPGSGDCQSNDPNKIPHTNAQAKVPVTWYIKEGTHNVTPAEDVQSPYGHAATWPKGVGPSGDKNAPNDTVEVTFNNPGLYFYYSSTNGEGSDDHGQLRGMCGVINVGVDTTPTTTPPTSPPSTTPDTQPPTTSPTTPPPAPTPNSTAPPATSPSTHAPTTAAPAPTTTTAVKGDKKPKDSSTTTTTTAPPAINIPPEAIIPDIAGAGTATQNGVVQPSSTPSGDAVALIKHKHSDNAKKMLILTGFGIGVLGIGAGAYKWANRSSKYFPA
jgi:hypothetical protein